MEIKLLGNEDTGASFRVRRTSALLGFVPVRALLLLFVAAALAALGLVALLAAFAVAAAVAAAVDSRPPPRLIDPVVITISAVAGAW